MADLPTRQDIYGADMRKMDRIGARVDKTLERIAKLEQRFELLTANNAGFLTQTTEKKKKWQKQKVNKCKRMNWSVLLTKKFVTH